ncbi:MAG: prepilin-type N-terminal cleavage/methylation domain-containing protein [Planctomycetes bacterium]|nr:prepilin-type N-terminal cleavage/methylation domain-containing protein [Planctomycetota bacterium]
MVAPAMHRSAFTLVEMLVILAIILILASLLLPALRQVKQSANALYCRGNLRQIGQGLQGYAQENRSVFPGREMYDHRGVKVDWATWIAPYIDAGPERTLNRGDASSRVLRCRNYPTWGIAQSGTNQGYAINYWMDTRRSAIASGATTMHVSERTNDNGFAAPKELDFSRHPGNGHRPYWWVGSGDQYGSLVTIPITQRIGALFVDGHVQMLNKAQVWTCLKWKVAGGDL